MLLQVPVGQVDDGCVLQIFFPDHLHGQRLRRTVYPRDQGNDGRKSEHDRRDEDDDDDEREDPHGNQAFVASKLHTITTSKYSMKGLNLSEQGALQGRTHLLNDI